MSAVSVPRKLAVLGTTSLIKRLVNWNDSKSFLHSFFLLLSYISLAELRAQESESKARDCELRYQGSEDPEHLRQVRRLRNTAAELRSMVSVRQNIVARKQKSIRDPKTLTFYFGVNVMNRACDGMFVYNCSRLIKMYQRIGPQQDSSMMCRGVVGIVDVPYMVLGKSDLLVVDGHELSL
ncbi:hypothetical protein AHF37_12445 [Paragonimus kellicotti]|nr:hypothetical protein AHF37_12445 [Paragonimus kellicotti]